MPMRGVAYGLGVSAPWPLPELGQSGSSGEVAVRLARRPVPPAEGDICLVWASVGRFVVRRGAEIVVAPARGVSRAALRLYLLGPAFAALLHQRGCFLLHASAVSVRGHAIAFLGDARVGKSTIAGAFVQRRHSLLADDVVALEPAPEGDFVVLPAFPQLKLWPDAAAALGLPPDLPRVSPAADKRAVRVRTRFITHAQPLVRAYVLEPGEAPALEPLTGAAAFLALIRCSYGRQTLHANRTSAHFAECAALARCVPLRRLVSTQSLNALPDLVRAVEDDLA